MIFIEVKSTVLTIELLPSQYRALKGVILTSCLIISLHVCTGLENWQNSWLFYLLWSSHLPHELDTSQSSDRQWELPQMKQLEVACFSAIKRCILSTASQLPPCWSKDWASTQNRKPSSAISSHHLWFMHGHGLPHWAPAWVLRAMFLLT